ncbi:MAG: retropepsin-like aspartic protease, partial [Lactobacillaceae bacterium]
MKHNPSDYNRSHRAEYHQAYPRGKFNNKNNKQFNYNKTVLGSRRCIIEDFLSSGRLPVSNARMSSLADSRNGQDIRTTETNFIEFDKKIAGTNVIIKERVSRIVHLKDDCTIRHMQKFEELGSANNWDDAAMAAIYLSLIDDERAKEKLCYNSYKKLKEQLTAIVYPQSEIRLLDTKLEIIKQDHFESIVDYYDELERHIEIYSHIHSLNGKETERKFLEVFYRGLGHFTYLEILKQNMQKTNPIKIFDYLKDLEQGILLQGNLARMKLNNNGFNYEYDNRYKRPSSGIPIINDKWCYIHHMKTHNTKDCALRNKLKRDVKQVESKTIQHEKKNYIIHETCDKRLKTLELSGRIGGIDKVITIDDGSSENYICETLVKNLKLITHEAKAINVKFGDSACETTNIKVKEKLTIGDEEFIVEFYVLKRLPVEVIIGLSFLESNSCVINYGNRTLRIKNKTVAFNGGEKSTDEILDHRLSEILDNSSTTSNEELNKLLKFYISVNDKFKCIKATPVNFIIKENIKIVQSKGYPVPAKYFQQGKEELKRLIK